MRVETNIKDRELKRNQIKCKLAIWGGGALLVQIQNHIGVHQPYGSRDEREHTLNQFALRKRKK